MITDTRRSPIASALADIVTASKTHHAQEHAPDKPGGAVYATDNARLPRYPPAGFFDGEELFAQWEFADAVYEDVLDLAPSVATPGEVGAHNPGLFAAEAQVYNAGIVLVME